MAQSQKAATAVSAARGSDALSGCHKVFVGARRALMVTKGSKRTWAAIAAKTAQQVMPGSANRIKAARLARKR
jgi:hypothetical protein